MFHRPKQPKYWDVTKNFYIWQIFVVFENCWTMNLHSWLTAPTTQYLINLFLSSLYLKPCKNCLQKAFWKRRMRSSCCYITELTKKILQDFISRFGWIFDFPQIGFLYELHKTYKGNGQQKCGFDNFVTKFFQLSPFIPFTCVSCRIVVEQSTIQEDFPTRSALTKFILTQKKIFIKFLPNIWLIFFDQ